MTPPGEQVTMTPKAGYYQRYIVDKNDGKPLPIHLKMTQPRATTKWSPSSIFCGQGDRLDQSDCVWLVVDKDLSTIYAYTVGGNKAVGETRVILSFRSRVGQPISIGMDLRPKGYSLSADGVLILSKEVDFDVHGYSFGCVSMNCTFDFPDE